MWSPMPSLQLEETEKPIQNISERLFLTWPNFIHSFQQTEYMELPLGSFLFPLFPELAVVDWRQGKRRKEETRVVLGCSSRALPVERFWNASFRSTGFVRIGKIWGSSIGLAGRSIVLMNIYTQFLAKYLSFRWLTDSMKQSCTWGGAKSCSNAEDIQLLFI